jgi:hypothetical protein
MALHPMLRWVVRIGATFLTIILFCWLGLYFTSLVQRRKAEQLFGDLKTFPLATARFEQVRDFAVAHGGHAAQDPSRIPPLCTIQNCTFNIATTHSLLRLSMNSWHVEMMLRMLAKMGIRPWGVFVSFEISNGELVRTEFEIGQIQFDSGEFGEVEYQLSASKTCKYLVRCDPRFTFLVGRPDNQTRGPSDLVLADLLLPASGDSLDRALAVDLRCFTRVRRGCMDAREIAPRAWEAVERGPDEGQDK